MKRFFWFKRDRNYGDVMTPYILKRLDRKFHYSHSRYANAIMIGSIAKLARSGMDILGSGFIRKSDPVCKDAKFHWVRGPLTRRMIIEAGGMAPELYGDAALLLPEFIPSSEKEHDIGYIPHHVDYNLINEGFKVDLTKGSIEDITKQITKCRKVICSSLHGIIVAHAYGIPAAWVKLSDNLSGDGMKFHDHYQSIGLKAQLSTMEDPIFQAPDNYETDHIKRIIVENT